MGCGGGGGGGGGAWVPVLGAGVGWWVLNWVSSSRLACGDDRSSCPLGTVSGEGLFPRSRVVSWTWV